MLLLFIESVFSRQLVDEKNWRASWWESFEETPLYAAILTYLGYGLLVLVGHIRDFFRNIGLEKQKSCTEPKLPVSGMYLKCVVLLAIFVYYYYVCVC